VHFNLQCAALPHAFSYSSGDGHDEEFPQRELTIPNNRPIDLPTWTIN
jgi:hypothetical protein